MRKRRARWLLCALAVSALLPARAAARRFRARFEVGTLEIEKPGELAFDAQLGGLYGDGDDGSRLLMPDFELDVGLVKWLELDIDGAFSLTRVGQASSEWVGDPLWTALRFDLYSANDETTGRTFGVGVQIGPRWPNLRNTAGIGGAGLLLVGGGTRTLHAVANLGATFDRDQPPALNYGAALELELSKPWSLIAQVAGTHYFGGEDDQLFVTAGGSAELDSSLELALLAVFGPAYQGDRAGLLLGATYRHGVW